MLEVNRTAERGTMDRWPLRDRPCARRPMTEFGEKWAATLAQRLIGWIGNRVDDSRREWVSALAAEMESVNGGWRKLSWALSGVSIAWSFRRRPLIRSRYANDWSTRAVVAVLQRQRGHAVLLASGTLAFVLLGQQLLVPTIIVFGPIASSLLLVPYARSLRGWRRTLVAAVGVGGFCLALNQGWHAVQEKPEAARVFVASELTMAPATLLASPWNEARRIRAPNRPVPMSFYRLGERAKWNLAHRDIDAARANALLLLAAP